MSIRTHFSLPPRYIHKLSPRFLARLEREQKHVMRLDADVQAIIRAHIEAYCQQLDIFRSARPVPRIIEQLEKIERAANKILNAPSSAARARAVTRLNLVLKMPGAGAVGPNAARLVALEHIAVNWHALREKRLGAKPRSASIKDEALNLLKCPEWDNSRLRDLLCIVQKTGQELRLYNQRLQELIAPIEGSMYFDGKPFKFVPDPLRNKGFRPEDGERKKFAGRMIRLYAWAGGDPKAHKLGMGEGAPDATPFMLFLMAVSQELPTRYRPRGTALATRGQRVLEQFGDGAQLDQLIAV